MVKSELEQLKEQTKLFHEQQRVIQAKLCEQQLVMLTKFSEKYPYGPWREVLFYPLALAIGLICIGALLGYRLSRLVWAQNQALIGRCCVNEQINSPSVRKQRQLL